MAKKTKKKRAARRGETWPWQTIALYAGSGVGKTTCAATAPKPMFLDSNFGTLSIEGKPGFDQWKRTSVTKMSDLDRAYANFTGTGRKNWTRFETIVFDHFDDIQGIVKDDLTQLALEKDPRRTPDETQQREWGILGNRLSRYLRKVKAIPMHKILIFSVGEDKITGQAQPFLQGSLGRQLPYFCDHIIFMRVRKGKRILYLDPTDEYNAKTRAWWIPKPRKFVFREDDTTFMTDLLRRMDPRQRTENNESGQEPEES